MRVKLKPPKNGMEEAGGPALEGFLRSQMGAEPGNTDFWRNDLVAPPCLGKTDFCARRSRLEREHIVGVDEFGHTQGRHWLRDGTGAANAAVKKDVRQHRLAQPRLEPWLAADTCVRMDQLGCARRTDAGSRWPSVKKQAVNRGRFFNQSTIRRSWSAAATLRAIARASASVTRSTR